MVTFLVLVSGVAFIAGGIATRILRRTMSELEALLADRPLRGGSAV